MAPPQVLRKGQQLLTVHPLDPPLRLSGADGLVDEAQDPEPLRGLGRRQTDPERERRRPEVARGKVASGRRYLGNRLSIEDGLKLSL